MAGQRRDDKTKRDTGSGAGGDASRQNAADHLLMTPQSVIEEWTALVRPRLWAELPPPRLVNSLPDILMRLVRSARHGATSVDDDLKDMIAREHGSIRREDEVPVAAVAEEWALLKEACRRTLRRRQVPEQDAQRLFDRLDLLMDDALGYTLRGYYRDELDALRGRGLERRDREVDRRRIERPDGDRRD